MKLKHSLFTRRQFLSSLFGGWLAALLGSFVYPVIKFIFPPYNEPDKVILPLAEYESISLNSVKRFSWGSKPGLIKKNEDGNLTAFIAVCTHLDCTVAYLQDQRKFFCACHEGWYDKDGINIGGPPPRPLRRLVVAVEGEELVVKKEGIE